MTASVRRRRSKTLATWMAMLLGPLGAHRFYLAGLRDPWGWLYLPPTLLGLYGVQRARSLGQDDMIAWALIPLLGLSVTAAMVSALVYGLMPDERWNARYNAGLTPRSSSWLAVFGVVVALAVGSSVLVATIAFSGQRYFEYQIEEGLKISR